MATLNEKRFYKVTGALLMANGRYCRHWMVVRASSAEGAKTVAKRQNLSFMPKRSEPFGDA